MALRRVVAWFLFVIFVVATLTQVLLPKALAGRVKQALRERLVAADYLEVTIESRPAIASLWGRFHRISLEAKDFVLDDLPIADFRIRGNDVRLDPGALYANGQIVVDSAEDLEVAVSLAETGINEYMWHKIDPDRQLRVALYPQGASLLGRINFLGHGLDIHLQGIFQIKNETQLIFVPEGLIVENLQVPPVILNALVEDRALVLDLAALPIPLVLDEARLDEGQLSVVGHYAKIDGEGR